MQRRYDRSEELDKEAQDITDKLSEVKKAEKQRQANIKNKEADIIKLQELLEKDPPKIEPEDELAEQLKSVKLDISGIKTEFNEKNEELMAAIARKNGALHQISRIEQDIKNLQSPDSKKLAMLQKWDPDSYAAVVWLRQNRNLFEQEIFEPPIISCAVKSSEFAPFVEAFFNGSQMKMFVAQSKRDLDVLNKHINDNPVNGRKLRIATWYKQCSDESFAPPPMTRDQMAELGFDGYALDYLEYPSGMEYYLKDMNLHRNAICRKPNLDVARAMELVGHSGGAWFTNGRTMNQVSKSRYGKRAVGNMTRDIQDAKSFVHPPVDTAAQQKYQDEINGYRLEIEAAEEKKSELVPLIEAISARDKERKAAFVGCHQGQQRKHQEFKAELTKNQRKLTAAKDNLRELQNRPSADEARNRLRAKLLGVCEKRLKLAKECRVRRSQDILEKQLQCAKAGFAFLQAETNHAHLKALCEERDAKYHEAAREFDRVNQAFAKMKVEVVGLLDVAKEKAEALDDETEAKERLRKMQSDLAEYDRQVKAAKQNGGPLPDTEGIELRTAAEIEEALGTFRTNLDMIISTNPGVLEEYEKRQRDIERYQITIQETEAKIAASAKKIKSTKDKWLPALQKLVDSIGSRFSHSFEGIGCAGEIRIKEEEDYAKWAIEIYVKFRDTEKLQLLTGQRQSGGERSLTTILYLMSLTEEARAPFSLGMDQRAERVVHNSMVRVTCKEDSAQYFLITPKLLTDLKYDARMKILCVNNGEWLPDEKGIGNMMNMIEGYVSHRAGG
ncbi:hypothetical protein BKA70DRAFT_1421971 [Coprinopsis sp. MPI-PUGE-AT-0042]|nr:hypothetical protein BKA70DRAFT_1421971 [Coprinopsis sp. MPI-PUGE-AT-0042]